MPFPIIFSLLLLAFLPDVYANPGYVGSESCASCHQEQTTAWQSSHHYQAMQPANAMSVLGDFSDTQVQFHSITTRFYTKQGDYFVTTADQKGEQKTFQVAYTFGFEPLQQYLIRMDDGHVQALNIAWDSRSKEAGGQRWFHLQQDEDINPEHPFFWTRHFQNWNSRCADCHSTNVQVNYDSKTHQFATTYSDVNVGCESCHGPGKSHRMLVQNEAFTPDNTGFDTPSKQGYQWRFDGERPIALRQAGATDRANEIEICGACHSLRTRLSEPGVPGNTYHDEFAIQLLNPPNYHANGLIQEEVFVLGSFLQSKMHEQGVTCSNCHNPHSGRLISEGNTLCAQCHAPSTYDRPEHHRHTTGSEGAQCVACHMPATTYMSVDPRRDHSFSVPNPSVRSNACLACHTEPSIAAQWPTSALTNWDGLAADTAWARLMERTQNHDILATREASVLIQEGELTAMRVATLLSQFAGMPSRVSAETAVALLGSESPLVRRAAVMALSGLPGPTKWSLLQGVLDDPSRSVRIELARTLADVSASLNGEDTLRLAKLLAEYRAALALQAYSPGSQLERSQLALRLGRPWEAEEAINSALKIEPNYVPALLNLADLYRAQGKTQSVEPLLKKALKMAPDSAAAQHSLGLFFVRQKNYQAALKHLALAAHQTEATPRYVYVYAVALDNQSKTQQAIDELKRANTRWPNQFEHLVTLIAYLEKTGQTQEVLPYVSQLSAISPGSPLVKQLLDKYKN